MFGNSNVFEENSYLKNKKSGILQVSDRTREDIIDYSKIEMFFVDDIDIVNIHNNIIYSLEESERDLPSIVSEFDKVYDSLVNPRETINILKYRNILGYLCFLIDRMRMIETLETKNSYISASSYYISEYKRIGPLKKFVSLESGNEKITKEKDNDDYHYRIKLVKDYLNVARKYITLNVFEESRIGDNVCDRCGVERVFETTEKGVTYCSVCRGERKVLIVSQFRKDNEDEAVIHNPTDTDNTFYKTLMRIQGKLSTIPEDVINDVESKLLDVTGRDPAQIRSLPLTEDGRKEGTSQKIMVDALNSTNNSEWAKEWVLLCHEIWGWSIPEFGGMEDIFIHEYNTGIDVKVDDIVKKYESLTN